jgi:hypothetical protein
MKTIDFYTVELQRDSADFSDAKTIGEFRDVRVATAHLIDESRGHRRLIGWIDLDGIKSPLELIRI